MRLLELQGFSKGHMVSPSPVAGGGYGMEARMKSRARYLTSEPCRPPLEKEVPLRADVRTE